MGVDVELGMKMDMSSRKAPSAHPKALLKSLIVYLALLLSLERRDAENLFQERAQYTQYVTELMYNFLFFCLKK